MKILVVDHHELDYVPVKGTVTVRLSLGLKEYPPSLTPPKDASYSHRYIEAQAVSPTLEDLAETARYWRNKYNRGTTHTFFETIEITKVGKQTILDLGFGS